MFEEIGHFVEKIRRVGYGPLVLDMEPGNMRELEAEELEDLRKAAEGKLQAETERYPPTQCDGCAIANAASQRRVVRKLLRPPREQPSFPPRREFPPKKQFGTDRPQRAPSGRAGEGFRPKPDFAEKGPARFGSQRPGSQRSGPRGFIRREPGRRVPAPRLASHNSAPAARRGRRTTVPPVLRLGLESVRRDQNNAQHNLDQRPPRPDRPTGGFAGTRRPESGRPFEKKPWKKPDSDRPAFKPHAGPRRDPVPKTKNPRRPDRPSFTLRQSSRKSESTFRPTTSRPPTGRPGTGRTPFRGNARPSVPADAPVKAACQAEEAGQAQFRPRPDRAKIRPTQTAIDRPTGQAPRSDRPRFDRPTFDRTSGARPAGGPAAQAVGISARAVPHALQATVHDLSPPAAANPVQAALVPATNAPRRPRPGKPAWKSKARWLRQTFFRRALSTGGFSKSWPRLQRQTGRRASQRAIQWAKTGWAKARRQTSWR